MDLRGKRALVMGLGSHGGGLGVARFLVAEGATVTVTDLRSAEALSATLEALRGLPIRYVLGEHRDEDFRQADLVVRNPAVPRESRLLQIARASGAQVEMEMTLFFRRCPGPILGVTGTKGKTTTTLLLGAMLRQHQPETVIAGNLRVSALEALPQLSATTPVVLELSSFALEGLGEAGLSPRYACITNISPDHLDRYPSLEAYAEAKRHILRHQGPDGVVVLNRGDARLAGWADSAPGQVVWFDSERSPLRPDSRPAMLYGARGLSWHAGPGDELHKLALGAEPICGPDDLRLPGQHNLANAAAAAALARAFGVSAAHIRAALQQFGGVEHRLELVRELDGVRYINDTAATAPEAAVAALQSIAGPIVLIAGGADKNLPFEQLAEAIGQRAAALVLLQGSATAKLSAALARVAAPPTSGPYDDFAAAIRQARALATRGGAVLLSPGCASFGMFRNEFHRGEEFRRIVGEL